jgi:hypothetical protein
MTKPGRYLSLALILLIIVLSATAAEAGWLIYHEPEFKGTVIDIETKKPIEGAVVVAVYRKATMGLGAGSVDSVIDVRETLTDSGGNFRIPSYTTVIQPFSWQIPSTIIIFKPGYASVELEMLLFSGKDMVEQEWGWKWNETRRIRLRNPGIVELPKLIELEERRKNIPSLPSWDTLLDKQKRLLRLINEEEVNTGLQESDPYRARQLMMNERQD